MHEVRGREASEELALVLSMRQDAGLNQGSSSKMEASGGA